MGCIYCLQQHAETGTNVNRERFGRVRVTFIVEHRHLIMSSKKNRRKTAPKLTAEFSFTCQHPMSVIDVKRRFLSVRLKEFVSVKKPLLRKNK